MSPAEQIAVGKLQSELDTLKAHVGAIERRAIRAEHERNQLRALLSRVRTTLAENTEAPAHLRPVA